MEKIKVCHLTSVHPALDTRIFYKEAKSLAKAGYDITLIAQHDKDETIDGIKIIALPKPKNRFERFFKLDYLAYKKALFQKANIYHFHDPELLPWMTLLKKKTKAKIIYDIHEDYPEELLYRDWIPKIFQNRLGKALLEKGEKFFAKFFDSLILTTELAAEKFKEFKDKVTIIYNFPILELFQKKCSKEKKYDVIIAGAISKNRLLTILKIGNYLKKLNPNFKWCIIGAPIDLINLGKIKAESLNLKKNFEFIPRIPHHQVIEYLFQSKIGFIHLPPEKRFERMLPIKLFEYMGCGLPVVSSELPLIHKFTDPYRCIIQLPSGDISGFAKAINHLLSHPEKAKEIGERGKKAVFENYNWAKEEIKLISLYKNLLL